MLKKENKMLVRVCDVCGGRCANQSVLRAGDLIFDLCERCALQMAQLCTFNLKGREIEHKIINSGGKRG